MTNPFKKQTNRELNLLSPDPPLLVQAVPIKKPAQQLLKDLIRIYPSLKRDWRMLSGRYWCLVGKEEWGRVRLVGCWDGL